MATKRKSSGSTLKPAAGARPSVGKRPDPTQVRSGEWSNEWLTLFEKYGGQPRYFAEEVLGVSYQSLWRYGVRGDDIPAVVANFVRLLAATQSVKSPV